MFKIPSLFHSSSSSLYYRTIICTRHYNSGVESSLVQLSDAIGLVYRELDLEEILEISQDRLAAIQSKIRSGLYNLSPLEVHYVDNRDDLHQLLFDNLMDYPDVKVETSNRGSRIFRVVTPKTKEDVIVLRALSVTLLCISQGSLPKDSLGLESQRSSLYDRLQQHGKANRIYKISLDSSKWTIPIHVVEEQIQSLLGDYSVSKLLWSFIHLPIINNYEICGKGLMSICGIPPVGELSKVLFHITLLGTLDREFPIRFPGITLHRLLYEVYVFTTDTVLIDEKAVLKVLTELSLSGKIESTGPGDKPLTCYSHKRIYLNTDSEVNLCDYNDYKDYPTSVFFIPKF